MIETLLNVDGARIFTCKGAVNIAVGKEEIERTPQETTVLVTVNKDDKTISVACPLMHGSGVYGGKCLNGREVGPDNLYLAPSCPYILPTVRKV